MPGKYIGRSSVRRCTAEWGGEEGGRAACRLLSVDTGWYNRLLPITSNMSSRAPDDEESSIISRNKMAGRARSGPLRPLRYAHPRPPSAPCELPFTEGEISRRHGGWKRGVRIIGTFVGELYIFRISPDTRDIRAFECIE